MKIKSLIVGITFTLFYANTSSFLMAMDEEEGTPEKEINFSHQSLNDLKKLGEADFAHEKLFLQNLTSQKFNVIKPALEKAVGFRLEGDRLFHVSEPSIKVLSYSIDESLKKVQRSVDEFMYAIAESKKVEVCRYGTPLAGELAPDAAFLNREEARKYWSKKQDNELQDQLNEMAHKKKVQKEDRRGMRPWEKSLMDGAERDSSSDSETDD